MRAHPDLIEVLTLRARERGLTRSQYAEQILVGWCRSDPRNPRLDAIGKFVAGAPTPAEAQLANSLSFAARWHKFEETSKLILGAPPPSDWFEDTERYWPDDMETNDLPADDDAQDPLPPSFRKKAKK